MYAVGAGTSGTYVLIGYKGSSGRFRTGMVCTLVREGSMYRLISVSCCADSFAKRATLRGPENSVNMLERGCN